MNGPFHRHSFAERTGCRLGQVCRRLMRLQHALRLGLTRVGLSVGGANLVVAGVWVLVVAALLRYGVWAIVAALTLVFLAAGVNDVPNSVERENEWRMGYMGFGLYNSEGFRVDPHDPDERA